MMSAFPFHELKAETLRLMCKDLGAGAGVRRKREDMIAFLKDVEKRGCMCLSLLPRRHPKLTYLNGVSGNSTEI